MKCNVVTPTCVGLSPGKIADLQIKKLQELMSFTLFGKKVITQEEFQEQKQLAEEVDTLTLQSCNQYRL